MTQLFPPPAILLMGEPGTGKTFSLSTILSAGYELFILTTEPSGLLGLVDRAIEFKCIDNLHWQVISPGSPGWDVTEAIGKKVHSSTFQTLAEASHISRAVQSPYVLLARACNNFICARTGKEYGDVLTLGPKAVFVIDSLSGINAICRQNFVGFKPTLSQSDWGVIQTLVENFMRSFWSARRTSGFVLISHTERETNELSGMQHVTVSTLGRKLAPVLTGMGWSDIILSHRQQDNFYFATKQDRHVLKIGSLPPGDKIPPSFAPILTAWEKRQTLLP